MQNLQSPASNAQNFDIKPRITSLSAYEGSTGDSITLTGTGFDATAGNNTVKFGSTPATVTAASATSLTVTLTEAPAGDTAVTVKIGNQTSASLNFTRKPKITALTTAEIQEGKAVLIRGQTLTIAGTNFDPTPANNTVKVGGYAAALSAATATQLTVTVPGLVGAGNATVYVETNSKPSNIPVGTVPVVTLNVVDGGFY